MLTAWKTMAIITTYLRRNVTTVIKINLSAMYLHNSPVCVPLDLQYPLPEVQIKSKFKKKIIYSLAIFKSELTSWRNIHLHVSYLIQIQMLKLARAMMRRRMFEMKRIY